MSTITPTVGRVVWFYPAADQQTADFSPPAAGQPLAAIVAAVKAPDSVNLTVLDAMGFPHARINVLLLQEGREAPEGGFYATWMPYQKQQAEKHVNEVAPIAEVEAFAAKVARDAIASTSDFDGERRRAHAIQAALQTSNPLGREAADVLQAAQAYEAYLRGQ